MTFCNLVCGLIVASSITVSTLAPAANVSLAPIKDNSIYANVVDNSNALSGIFVGNNSSGAERRGLIAFDLASIPVGATINSVSLDMQIVSSGAPAGNNYNLHALLSDWGEGSSLSGNPNGGGGGNGAAATAGDATWNASFFGASAWGTAGGDFTIGFSASSLSGASSSMTWASAQMVSDVQSWLDGINSNFGWIMVGPGGSSTAIKFGSKQSSGANQPLLLIDYSVLAVPVPAAVWLFASGLLSLVGVGRMRQVY